ncbi:RNase J family beta-CASP ribonuclease [Candidatus Peregrinibacteria bacterium]|nr:RNase J family beta-CASP ribonuclease [Candidatus Peregrinibacteria bacterium]MBT4631768.1 RNase J family beta-CASP ribonuclease [Candidatus Peregrinibacteria bacterium]MBT5824507.1 RNase J family beta-CASP ribonuclease [Candidatus Peregrinibacteria bacterium]
MKKIDKLSSWLKGAVGSDPKKPSSPKPAAKPAHKASPKGSHSKNHSGHKKKRNGSAKKTAAKHHSTKQHKVRKPVPTHENVMRIIPIGGLEEVGKNAMIVEYEKDIVVIDMGFQFPEDEMLGVDYVIPDIQYLVQRKNRIRGILITHGHLDHIGALPFVMADLGFPTIYGSKLALGFVKRILGEHKLLKQSTLKEVNNKEVYQFGKLKVDFFRVNHSIPDSLGMAIRSPEGNVVHTGDFKFDFTPADGIECDMGKMAEIGKRGIHMMFSDSTNATKPGHTLSERVVGESLRKSIAGVEGRIVIACFASLIGRVQQIIDFAHAENRKVFLSGGSMIRNAKIAQELGFLKPPKGIIKDIKVVNDYPDKQVLILTTGSQGEPMAALSRMATNSHRQVQIKPGDTVVISASPIIGNEKSVAFLIDSLARLGAKIVHNRIMDVHTSGHGCQEDLKMMMALIKPDHLVPVHGNFYMRRAHGDLGPKVRIPEKNVHMMDNGNIIELRKGKVSFKHEDIGVRYVVIDGLGQGDLGSKVQLERESMSQNGIVNIAFKMNKGRLIGRPSITTHGFVYQKENDGIMKDIEARIKESVAKLHTRDPRARAHDYENYVRSAVSGLILKRLDRRPLVATKVIRA